MLADPPEMAASGVAREDERPRHRERREELRRHDDARDSPARKLPRWKSAASKRFSIVASSAKGAKRTFVSSGRTAALSAREVRARAGEAQRDLVAGARAAGAREREQALEVVRARHAAGVEQADLRVAEQLAANGRIGLGRVLGLDERPGRQRLAARRAAVALEARAHARAEVDDDVAASVRGAHEGARRRRQEARRARPLGLDGVGEDVEAPVNDGRSRARGAQRDRERGRERRIGADDDRVERARARASPANQALSSQALFPRRGSGFFCDQPGRNTRRIRTPFQSSSAGRRAAASPCERLQVSAVTSHPRRACSSAKSEKMRALTTGSGWKK